MFRVHPRTGLFTTMELLFRSFVGLALINFDVGECSEGRMVSANGLLHTCALFFQLKYLKPFEILFLKLNCLLLRFLLMFCAEGNCASLHLFYTLLIKLIVMFTY